MLSLVTINLNIYYIKVPAVRVHPIVHIMFQALSVISSTIVVLSNMNTTCSYCARLLEAN